MGRCPISELVIATSQKIIDVGDDDSERPSNPRVRSAAEDQQPPRMEQGECICHDALKRPTEDGLNKRVPPLCCKIDGFANQKSSEEEAAQGRCCFVGASWHYVIALPPFESRSDIAPSTTVTGKPMFRQVMKTLSQSLGMTRTSM